MKYLLPIIALLFLAKPVFPVVDYVVNYEYISKVLCENKAKPELECNGKCQLMKELAKAAEEEKPLSSDKKNTTPVFEILFFQEINDFKWNQVYFQDRNTTFNHYSDLYFYLNSDAVFHPPIFIS